MEMVDTSWMNIELEEVDPDLPDRDEDEMSYEDENLLMSSAPIPAEAHSRWEGWKQADAMVRKGDVDEPRQDQTTTVSDRASELSAGLRAVTKTIPEATESMASERSIPTPHKRKDLVAQLASKPRESLLETDESLLSESESLPAAIKHPQHRRAASVKSSGSAMIDTSQITRIQQDEEIENYEKRNRNWST